MNQVALEVDRYMAYVCPTYVGMNRSIPYGNKKENRMPHVCGDEPLFLNCVAWRGTVCPTYVGMNRLDRSRAFWPMRMPHVCGDEPTCR